MPRKPEVPCNRCGKLLTSTRTSAPAGQRRCRECRRIESQKYGPRPTLGLRKSEATYVCAFTACGKEFARYVRLDRPDLAERCCSKSCMMRRRAELAGHFVTEPGQRYSPEQLRAKNYRRRTARRQYDITADQEREMRAKAKRCPLCDVKFVSEPFRPASKELDHIIPVVMGGTHTHGNVRIICRRCNGQRPKDGSDYTGPVTLWAEDLDVVLPASVSPRRPCKCGTPRSRHPQTQRLMAKCEQCQQPAEDLVEKRRQQRLPRVERTITCPYCKTTLTVTRTRQKTCGSNPCQSRSRLDSWYAWDDRKRQELGASHRRKWDKRDEVA